MDGVPSRIDRTPRNSIGILYLCVMVSPFSFLSFSPFLIFKDLPFTVTHYQRKDTRYTEYGAPGFVLITFSLAMTWCKEGLVSCFVIGPGLAG